MGSHTFSVEKERGLRISASAARQRNLSPAPGEQVRPLVWTSLIHLADVCSSELHYKADRSDVENRAIELAFHFCVRIRSFASKKSLLKTSNHLQVERTFWARSHRVLEERKLHCSKLLLFPSNEFPCSCLHPSRSRKRIMLLKRSDSHFS